MGETKEDGGKALNARQEEDGRQKPIRQPGSRVPSFSQLFRPLEDQDTARNECEKKSVICGPLFVLAIMILRWAVDYSAAVSPYYFPSGKLNLR